MSERSISPLRRRLIEYMTVRRFSEDTQRDGAKRNGYCGPSASSSRTISMKALTAGEVVRLRFKMKP